MAEPAPSARLVPMGEEHLAATFAWMSNPALRRQLDSVGEPTAAENAAYWRRRWADARLEVYAILDREGRHVGNCGLNGIDLHRRKAELWIYVGYAGDRGSGCGATAVRALLTRAFEGLRLNRVFLRVLATNMAAERFYHRLGFVSEGCWRADTWQDEQPVDAHWYSMLADEYRRLQA